MYGDMSNEEPTAHSGGSAHAVPRPETRQRGLESRNITRDEGARSGAPAADKAKNAVEVVEVAARIPTLVESALTDYTRQVIVNSLDNAIEFHKTMLGVSATFGTLTTTLIPILSWGNKDARIPLPEGWFLLAPPAFMLASAICFALGYFPRSAQLKANLLEDVGEFRAEALAARRRLAVIGLSLFCCSILLTVVLTTMIRARSAV
jgi:hypothetical protein